MTEQEAIEMIDAGDSGGGDVEVDHSHADDVLIQFIRELGYNALADRWSKVEKWYG